MSQDLYAPAYTETAHGNTAHGTPKLETAQIPACPRTGKETVWQAHTTGHHTLMKTTELRGHAVTCINLNTAVKRPERKETGQFDLCKTF